MSRGCVDSVEREEILRGMLDLRSDEFRVAIRKRRFDPVGIGIGNVDVAESLRLS